MEDLFGFFLIRAIVRTIGLFARYLFFLVIGKKRKLKSLQGDYLQDEYKNMGKNFSQDIINTIIGTIIFCFLAIFIASLVFG